MGQAADKFGKSVLDCAHEKLMRGDVACAMTELFAGLHQLRRRVCDEQWEAFCIVCREHPICALLHEDPLTAYAYAKPNGFAPDAPVEPIAALRNVGDPLAAFVRRSRVAERLAQLRDKAWPLLETGNVRVVIHATFDLADVAQAHALMESSKHIGKIMLRVRA